MREQIYEAEGRARDQLTEMLDEFGYVVSVWTLKDDAEGLRTLTIVAKRNPDQQQLTIPIDGEDAS